MGTEVVPVDDETAETKVKFCRPRGLNRAGPDAEGYTSRHGSHWSRDRHARSGTDMPTRPLSGAKLKWPRIGLPIQQTRAGRRPLPDAETHSR